MRQPRRYVRFINPLRLYYKHNDVKSEKSVLLISNAKIHIF